MSGFHFSLLRVDFCQDARVRLDRRRKYFQFSKFRDILMLTAFPANLPSETAEKGTYRRFQQLRHVERSSRACYLHFLEGLLRMDPRKRWSPRQALQHPFVTGFPFDLSFEPDPDPLYNKSRPKVFAVSAYSHQA